MPHTGITLLLLLYLPLGAIALDLNSHLWEDRLLLLIAPSVDDPLAIQQRQALEKRSDALNDRDLKIFQLYEDSPSQFDNTQLTDGDAQQLRAKLKIDSGSRALILIGKDGSIKRRAPIDTELREIFMQIDEMPMRREEMEDKIEAGMPVTLP
ncbi:MAG: DUF4174 domain-containing protein [Gammaproteobacteria bacterium]|nr:DUF4174 domain-containing protein [Gammaproteobacteria bacterium]